MKGMDKRKCWGERKGNGGTNGKDKGAGNRRTICKGTAGCGERATKKRRGGGGVVSRPF